MKVKKFKPYTSVTSPIPNTLTLLPIFKIWVSHQTTKGVPIKSLKNGQNAWGRNTSRNTGIETLYKACLRTVAEIAMAAFFDMKVSIIMTNSLSWLNCPRNGIVSIVRIGKKRSDVFRWKFKCLEKKNHSHPLLQVCAYLNLSCKVFVLTQPWPLRIIQYSTTAYQHKGFRN